MGRNCRDSEGRGNVMMAKYCETDKINQAGLHLLKDGNGGIWKVIKE